MKDLKLRKSIFMTFRLNILLVAGYGIHLIKEIGALLAAATELYNLYSDKSMFKHNNSIASEKEIKECESYTKHYEHYKEILDSVDDIEETSQYYIYKRLEQVKPKTVCNIGCNYCAADYHFLKKSPETTIYGLDFGDLEKLNSNFKHENLIFCPGYPLRELKKFKEEGRTFEYAIFIRVANVINPKQMITYMSTLAEIADNVIFLEVGKLTVYRYPVLNVNAINLSEGLPMYRGLYIHNYPKLLTTNGYNIVEQNVLPYDSFHKPFDTDHDFIYMHGRKKLVRDVAGR